MNTRGINNIFFSPTSTTRATVEEVARGTGATALKTLDLTRHAPDEAVRFTDKDLVIVGMPVHSSRLPVLAVERFKLIRGDNTPVVPIAVYGNRTYGDALLELSELCVAQGFHTVAAAAFIGEHSFSSAELPIAVGRPDAEDLRRAREFGRRVADALETCQSIARLKAPDIPGNHPYKAPGRRRGAAIEADPRRCVFCGKCVEICPTRGISMSADVPVTDPDNCIWCMACLRGCPVGARGIALPQINATAKRLYEACRERRQPEIFLK